MRELKELKIKMYDLAMKIISAVGEFLSDLYNNLDRKRDGHAQYLELLDLNKMDDEWEYFKNDGIPKTYARCSNIWWLYIEKDQFEVNSKLYDNLPDIFVDKLNNDPTSRGVIIREDGLVIDFHNISSDCIFIECIGFPMDVEVNVHE